MRRTTLLPIFYSFDDPMNAFLGPAEILALSGTDAASFAQTQFTSDVTGLASRHWQWSSWLDPQGRVRCFFVLLRSDDDRFIAWLPLGGATAMRDALARFVMRAKVDLEVLTDWALRQLSVAPGLNGHTIVAQDGGFAFAQPGTTPRIAWIGAAGPTDPPADREALDEWRRADINAGLPLIAPELSGEFVAQALDLERLDAIRFDKGCYPGQEIVARLHFRGGNKRHLRRVSIEAAEVPVGTPVLDLGQKTVGRILYSAPSSGDACEALAVLQDSVDPGPLRSANGAAIRVHSSFA